MNNLRNSVRLVGHLGADPEFKKLDNGGALTKFSLATNEYYKGKDGEKMTTTHWHNCVAWGKTAELMHQLLKKGQEVILSGRINYNSYQDQNGQNRKRTEIIVHEFSKVGKKEVEAS